MIDKSFFDEKEEVRPERLDEFIAHLHATQARGIYVSLTGPVGNALLAHRRKRAEAEKRGESTYPPETDIPFLKDKLSDKEYLAIVEIIGIANFVQQEKLPQASGSLAFYMELAAAFLAVVIEHVAIQAREQKSYLDEHPDFNFMEIILDLVVQRAREMQEQRNA